MPVSLQEALARAGSMNKRKRDSVSGILLEMAENGPKRYIYNVFNLQWVKNLGSLGRKVIPSVETNGSDRPADWEPFSKPLVIPHLTVEEWDRGEGQSSHTPWPSDMVVADIIGSNQSHPRNDLRNYGVFVAAGEKPTKEEIAEAKVRLAAQLADDLRDGDNLWGGDAKQRAQISNIHRRAARYLGVKREWDSAIVAQSNCPFCASSINPGALKCTSCGEILDQERFDAAKAKAAGKSSPKIPVPNKQQQ